MAKRSENPDEVIKRIMSLPSDEENDDELLTEQFNKLSGDFWSRAKAEPGDTVLKLLDEARLFEG